MEKMQLSQNFRINFLKYGESQTFSELVLYSLKTFPCQRCLGVVPTKWEESHFIIKALEKRRKTLHILLIFRGFKMEDLITLPPFISFEFTVRLPQLVLLFTGILKDIYCTDSLSSKPLQDFNVS